MVTSFLRSCHYSVCQYLGGKHRAASCHFVTGCMVSPEVLALCLLCGEQSHGKVRDFLFQHDDLSPGYPGGTSMCKSLQIQPHSGGLWPHDLCCGPRRPRGPLCPCRGACCRGAGWEQGAAQPLWGYSLNNANIHPRQALALLASEGGAG